MAILDLIEYPDIQPDEIVHRVPEYGSGEFRLGSQCVVRESQRAVFFRDGKALDVLPPGRHTISTANLPILSSILGSVFGGKSPFTAEVYFVNMREFTDMKWGTPQPVLMRDKDFGMVRIRAFGTYSMRVADPQLFVNQIVGARGTYSTSDIEEFLRSIVVNELADLLGETMTSVLDAAGMSMELAQGAQHALADNYTRLGLELRSFQIASIALPDEVQKAIDQRSSMGALGDMRTYTQYQTAQAIGHMGEGDGGGGGALSEGAGLGAGLGLGAAMSQALRDSLAPAQPAAGGGAAPAQQQPAAPAAALGTRFCPNCGNAIAPGAKFCANCGFNLAQAANACPKCSTVNPPGSKFCQNCGQALT
jgi:membrane protease subunit (stomatin/prohibitin family)